jgi:hypothetical protein
MALKRPAIKSPDGKNMGVALPFVIFIKIFASL